MTRTKKGRARMGYKPEHTADVEAGVGVDVDLIPGDDQDSADLTNRMIEAGRGSM